ncbi:hypothetical protein [Rothia mucilaginosa]|uniref:hypothetical protein n=1 Tax=Rothia mucilaginosa TaxID=43675 RepID=UPI00066E1CE0|nr:hypothetical protein [Rothia mucilaginosa]
MSSSRIRLYPVEADYGFLGLSTAPASDTEGLHLGGCMVSALEELEDEGVSFEQWLKESFYTGDENLFNNLTRSILYNASEEGAVRTFLQERGFTLPTLRIADLGEVEPLDASGIPPLVNETDEVVERLFELIDLYVGPAEDGEFALWLRPSARRTVHLLAVHDDENPRWIVQPWDWEMEDWAGYCEIQVPLSGAPEPLQSFPRGSSVKNLRGMPVLGTHSILNDQKAITDALDAAGLFGSSHFVSPGVFYVGRGEKHGVEMDAPVEVYAVKVWSRP